MILYNSTFFFFLSEEREEFWAVFQGHMWHLLGKLFNFSYYQFTPLSYGWFVILCSLKPDESHL